MTDRARNPDGTWNGVVLMARWSGLSEAEIAWTWKRLKELMDAGKTKDEAKTIVATEGTVQPWLNK